MATGLTMVNLINKYYWGDIGPRPVTTRVTAESLIFKKRWNKENSFVKSLSFPVRVTDSNSLLTHTSIFINNNKLHGFDSVFMAKTFVKTLSFPVTSYRL